LIINRPKALNALNTEVIEKNLFALCFATEDQKERMSAFEEKRKADSKVK